MLSLGHITNPFKSRQSSRQDFIQSITFHTMQKAKEFAFNEADINLFTAQFKEDSECIPADFQATKHLERSALDLKDFQVERKLPLVHNILERLFNASPADYLIYTNIDIGLQPHFYLTILQKINAGHDAFVINRRTISDHYDNVDQIPAMYAEVGKKHLGYDCFIFHRSLFPKFIKTEAIIGAGRVGKVLLLNLMCNAQNFHEFTDLHATFHLGDDKIWKSPALFEYDQFNNQNLKKVWFHYLNIQKLPNHPLIARCKPWSSEKEESIYNKRTGQTNNTSTNIFTRVFSKIRELIKKNM